MKKLIAIILSLVMLLSLAACAPSEGSTDPATDVPTVQPTEKSTDPTEGGDIVIGDDPTDPPTEPQPTDPPVAELQANGICAVGIVDAEAGTAKILADNGAIAEISYTSDADLIPGNLYVFAKNGDVYQLTPVSYINPDGAWGVRTFDNSYADAPDQLFTHDGTYGRLYKLTEDCVIFVRFSETEYRVFSGSDAIKYSDYPCYMQFCVNPVATEVPDQDGIIQDAGTCNLILVVGDVTKGQLHADEAASWFYDTEGYGWDFGDLIIE